MKEEKKKINTDETGSYQQVISESGKVSATKMELKKVPNMVGTFFNKDITGRLFIRVIGYSYQQITSEYVSVTVTKVSLEKIAIMVGTFLKEDMRIHKYQPLKRHRKRLPLWWEPF